MLKNLLFTMSLSGSIVMGLYFLLYPLAKRYFPLKWRYNVLKIAIAFYLIPFPELKYIIVRGIYCLIPDAWGEKLLVEGMMKPEYMIILGRNLLLISSKVKRMALVMLIVGMITLIVVLKRYITYRRMSRLYFTHDREVEGEQKKLFVKLKEELGIKKKIRFICSEYCSSPMSGGILSSVVIFPEWDKDELESDVFCDIIKHELVHIKHHDLLIKLLGLAVIAVHWFNPFSYFLFYELSIISEMYCDSVVLLGKGDEECYKYGKLILKFAKGNKSSESSDEWKFFSGIAHRSTKHYYKRRILEMRANRKNKVMLSMLMTGVICMAGGITAFAYNPSKVISDHSQYGISTDVSIVTDEIEQELEKLPYDYFCIDENGDIHDLNNIDEEARALCIHEYRDGKVIDHQKDGKGGCVVRTYKAKVCKFCAYTIVGDLISTTTYTVCPH